VLRINKNDMGMLRALNLGTFAVGTYLRSKASANAEESAFADALSIRQPRLGQ
jgi:hypothetical protein